MSVCIARRNCNCQNPFCNKAIVLDSSSLFNIMRASINSIPAGIPRSKRFDSFFWILKEVLSKGLLCCEGGVMSVTREIFNEMDPLDNTSSIRSLSFFNEICGEERTSYSIVKRLLEGVLRVSPQNVPAPEIGYVRQEIRSSPELYRPPSSNDLSLIVLVLKLSDANQSVLIADDVNLRAALDIIRRERHFLLLDQTFDTEKVLYTDSLSFFEHPYGCCEILSRDFLSLLQVFDDWSKELRSSFNPLYLVYERLVSHVSRQISRINK